NELLVVRASRNPNQKTRSRASPNCNGSDARRGNPSAKTRPSPEHQSAGSSNLRSAFLRPAFWQLQIRFPRSPELELWIDAVSWNVTPLLFVATFREYRRA